MGPGLRRDDALLIRSRRLQVGILGVDLVEQLEVQRLDGFLQHTVQRQPFLFFKARDSRPRLIQSGVGVENVFLNADSLLALHYFKSRLPRP